MKERRRAHFPSVEKMLCKPFHRRKRRLLFSEGDNPVAISASYLDYVKDLFSPFGAITIRKMFGGAGVYCDGAIFAITGDDGLWLKVDDVTRAEFDAAGLEPFTYEFENGKAGKMSYYSAPEEIYDDNDALTKWTELALAAAQRAKKPKKKTKKRTKS